MNIKKYKKQLLEQKNKLTDLISDMKDNTLFGNTTNHTSERYTSGELSSYDNHPGDIGTDLYMQDMQNSLTTHEKGKLNEIDAALYRIENGTYGVCEQCNQNISEDRLDILPETNLCNSCAKQKQEVPTTSGAYNQNLINKGSSFYDEVVMDLQEMNKIPNDNFYME